ncbi:MAG: hypothetical protein R6W66_03275 [Pelovirga sp.]
MTDLDSRCYDDTGLTPGDAFGQPVRHPSQQQDENLEELFLPGKHRQQSA